MRSGSRWARVLRAYLPAAAAAIALTLVVDLATNATPPRWDGLYYVDMAERGLAGNPNLIAPFAYRPVMPLASGAVARLLSTSVENGFRVVGWSSILAFLVLVFGLARSIGGGSAREALAVMALVGLSWQHVKFPLFFPTLVDVAAYPVVVAAFWALLAGRDALCLGLAGAGLLLKEFLVVPWLLLLARQGRALGRLRSSAAAGRLAASAAVGIVVLALPRMLLDVRASVQFVDPIRNPASLGRLLEVPLDPLRLLNVAYAFIGYWLPALLLATRARLAGVRDDLRAAGALAPCCGFAALVLLLTLFGGDNIAVFASYSAPVLALVLALLLRRGVGAAEVAWAVAAVAAYNLVPLPIPSPETARAAYIDFYGGWASRVTPRSLLRLLECALFVLVAVGIRRLAGRSRPAGRDAEAAADSRDGPRAGATPRGTM